MTEATKIKYPRRTQRKIETRKRIVQAANRLLRSVESSSLTMAMVAEEADIHVTTLFTHFSNKAELMTAMSEPPIALLTKRVHKAIGEEIPFFQFLHELQHEFFSNVEAGGVEAIYDIMFLRSQVDMLPAWLVYEKRQVELYAQFLLEDFEMTNHQATLIAGMIVTATIYTYDAWLNDPKSLSLVEAAEANVTEVERIVTGMFSEKH